MAHPQPRVTGRSESAPRLPPESQPHTGEDLATERRARFALIDRSDRRRRVSPSALVGTLLVAGLAFGALAAHISLIHRQMRLDAIRTEITRVQTDNKNLRRQESRLQAPDEIRRIALDVYLMVDPEEPGFLRPEPLIIGAAPEGAAVPAATAVAADS